MQDHIMKHIKWGMYGGMLWFTMSVLFMGNGDRTGLLLCLLIGVVGNILFGLFTFNKKMSYRKYYTMLLCVFVTLGIVVNTSFDLSTGMSFNILHTLHYTVKMILVLVIINFISQRRYYYYQKKLKQKQKEYKE